MNINYFSISSLLIILTTFPLAYLLFIKGKSNRPAKLWGILCVSVGFWGFGSFMGSISSNKESAFLWFQIANIGSISIGPIFYHFVYGYFKLNNRFFLISQYVIAFLILYLNFFQKQYFFGDVALFRNEFYFILWSSKYGYAYPLFYIYFYWILLSYSFLIFINQYKKSTYEKRNQIKYFILSSIFGWTGGIVDFWTALGFNIYPYPNLFIGIFPLITGYAILKHKLMDINIIIKRSIVYSTLIGILSILFLIIVLVSERLSQYFFNYNSSIISILAAIIFAVIFMPLRNKIQDLVDKIFFKATPIELAQQNEMLLKEVSEKERFKKVATLASGMAHEIKNPLTAIKTFTEYLEKHKNDPDFYTKFSKIVGKEVDRIDDLVHQLLEFSKPFPIELKQSDIVKLVDDTLAFLDSQFLKSNITVEKVYDLSNPILVNMDPVQIRQVIVNIFINAAEAMKFGGILTVTISTAKNQVIISTRDTGSGIAPEDLKHIFEPFFTKKDNGTGLGLSISYGIIEKHKGKIEVKSAVGIGTEFKIKLPMTKYLNENRLT